MKRKTVDMRQCTQCEETKPVDEFSKRQGKCKQCRNLQRSLNYDPVKARGYALRRNYGLSHAEYDALVEEQGGKCLGCGVHESELPTHKGQPGWLSVDHCHTTGRVRGLLCRLCNATIGNAHESADRLRALAQYLDDRRQTPDVERLTAALVSACKQCGHISDADANGACNGKPCNCDNMRHKHYGTTNSSITQASIQDNAPHADEYLLRDSTMDELIHGRRSSVRAR